MLSPISSLVKFEVSPSRWIRDVDDLIALWDKEVDLIVHDSPMTKNIVKGTLIHTGLDIEGDEEYFKETKKKYGSDVMKRIVPNNNGTYDCEFHDVTVAEVVDRLGVTHRVWAIDYILNPEDGNS